MSLYDFEPPTDEELERLLGPVSEEEEPATEGFRASPLEQFLETFARAPEVRPPRRPRSFVEGLVYGTAGGIRGAGERVASARERFDKEQAERLAKIDERRIKAAEQREAAKSKLRAGIVEQRTKAKPVQKVTEGMLEQAPYLRRIGLKAGDDLDPDIVKLFKPEEQKQDDLAPALTQQGLDLTARQYATMGTLPPMGMGKAGVKVRQKIINRAAELFPDLDIASNVSGFQSDRASLTNVKRIRDASKAFAETADKNLSVLLETMKKIPGTRSPWLNRPIRNIKREALGDADLAAFEVARQTVIPEFARLLSSPTASGTLTDTARREIEAIVRGDYSFNQMLSAARVLRRDARNRTTSYDDQVREIEARISGRGRGPGQAEPEGPPLPAGFQPAAGSWFDRNAPGRR